MASSSPTSHNSNQMVTANGNQTSKPVSRYFLIGTRKSRVWPARPQWQAQALPLAPPEPAADAVAASDLVTGLAAGLALSPPTEAVSVLAPVAAATAAAPLKSVAYQPD